MSKRSCPGVLIKTKQMLRIASCQISRRKKLVTVNVRHYLMFHYQIHSDWVHLCHICLRNILFLQTRQSALILFAFMLKMAFKLHGYSCSCKNCVTDVTNRFAVTPWEFLETKGWVFAPIIISMVSSYSSSTST